MARYLIGVFIGDVNVVADTGESSLRYDFVLCSVVLFAMGCVNAAWTGKRLGVRSSDRKHAL